MYFCVVLCIFCFVTYTVVFVCICVLNYCHRVATQLQLNISYHIILSVELAVYLQIPISYYALLSATSSVFSLVHAKMTNHNESTEGAPIFSPKQ